MLTGGATPEVHAGTDVADRVTVPAAGHAGGRGAPPRDSRRVTGGDFWSSAVIRGASAVALTVDVATVALATDGPHAGDVGDVGVRACVEDGPRDGARPARPGDADRDVLPPLRPTEPVFTGTAGAYPGTMASAPRPSHDFDAVYADGTPPWDIGRPQPAFDHLAATGQLVGVVLDVGCGTGEHALMATSLGYEAVGVDLSTRAIDLARAKAAERGVATRFEVADALSLGDLGEQFDTVLDCGLFHTFEHRDRSRYVANLADVISPGGRFHMLCFSDLQPGDWGPRRVTQEEIRHAFAGGWRIESIESAVIELTWESTGVLAWLAAIAHD